MGFQPSQTAKLRWNPSSAKPLKSLFPSLFWANTAMAFRARHIDQWIDTNDHAVEFGSLQIEDSEILPADALDGEAPDQQRLTEASGNEGASFERAYHRAALVLWPQDHFVDVLLQAGPAAALPYFKDRVQASNSPLAQVADRQTLHSIAERVIAVWEATGSGGYRDRSKESDRSEMIALLGQLADAPLLERFIARVVTREYDGGENEVMAANVRWPASGCFQVSPSPWPRGNWLRR